MPQKRTPRAGAHLKNGSGIIIPEPSPFNESRFGRVRRLHAAEDFDACFASPEDAIIKKMEYYREGGSEKHLRDIAGVLKTSRDQIDLAYIDRWARQLGLVEIWDVIQKLHESGT
jgi:hypothetical protein